MKKIKFLAFCVLLTISFASYASNTFKVSWNLQSATPSSPPTELYLGLDPAPSGNIGDINHEYGMWTQTGTNGKIFSPEQYRLSTAFGLLRARINGGSVPGPICKNQWQTIITDYQSGGVKIAITEDKGHQLACTVSSV